MNHPFAILDLFYGLVRVIGGARPTYSMKNIRVPQLFAFLCALLPFALQASTLAFTSAPHACGIAAQVKVSPPPAAQHRLVQSQATSGVRDIAWAWLGSPTLRYPHAALGSRQHAASLHVLLSAAQAPQKVLLLPVHRVFEDRIPRLVDLDGDGRDEIILVEADAVHGAALVVFGLRNGALVELARGPHAGSTFRWLNPVGVADFDGDGLLDVASMTTPHIGGVLTLHRYRPPRLEPYARALDVSNHRMGELEQQLAVIVPALGQQPAILIPDMQLTALQALRWDVLGQWTELAPPLGVAGTRRALHTHGGRGGVCFWPMVVGGV
jgi:hypothetical protein